MTSVVRLVTLPLLFCLLVSCKFRSASASEYEIIKEDPLQNNIDKYLNSGSIDEKKMKEGGDQDDGGKVKEEEGANLVRISRSSPRRWNLDNSQLYPSYNAKPESLEDIYLSYFNSKPDEISEFVSPEVHGVYKRCLSADKYQAESEAAMKAAEKKESSLQIKSDKSSSPKEIREEINKIYQDISDNVKLLSKLQEKESQMSKKPVKRFTVIDPSEIEPNRVLNKRCSQEMTVEMDTNREATPDKLEHIERKTDEEILQVNVPIKCNT